MQVQTEDKCLDHFTNLKFRKIQARYIIYAIVNQKIVIDKVGNKTENWDDFLKALPAKQYRYCVFDFEFTNADNMAITKIIFINWSPQNAPIKGRVLYATAKQAFKKKLDLNNKDYTLGSTTDMTQAEMIKQLSK